MEVILTQFIPNLGQKDDVIIVSDGYARNYLIPRGYAKLATESAKKMQTEIAKQRAHKEAKLKLQAVELAEKMNGLKLSIGAKTSSKGKIFGSVNTIQISEALATKGYEVFRKNIFIKEEIIKEVGTYTAKIKLHKDVDVDIEFEVVSE